MRRFITETEIQQAKELRKTGMSLKAIGIKLGGFHSATISRAINPGVREQRRLSDKKYNRKYRNKSGNTIRVKAAWRQDADMRLSEIPEDRRDTTARVFGDPVFERSALYKKMEASQ